MDKEKIVQELVAYIEKVYADKRERYGKHCEISLFEWGLSLRVKVNNEHGVIVNSDANRILVVEAYNRTHPHSPYKIHPKTLDNPNSTFENDQYF